MEEFSDVWQSSKYEAAWEKRVRVSVWVRMKMVMRVKVWDHPGTVTYTLTSMQSNY
jgi:hypothetical protein